MMTHVQTLASLFALAATLAAAPARAGDGTDTGLIAALGITAATGKTTLGDGAGAIEAALYSGNAYQHAGAIIAQLVDQRRDGRPVLILARGEKLDLLTPQVLRDEVKRLTTLVDRSCQPAKSVAAPIIKLQPYAAELEGAEAADNGVTLRLADAVGAAATDTAIGGIELSSDDRSIINAVLMNAPGAGGPWTTWTGSVGSATVAPASAPVFFVPGEAAGMPPGETGFYQDYRNLVGVMAAKRATCAATDEGKAAIASADAFVTGLNKADDGPAPLASAIAADAFRALEPHPLILRLTVEQAGGTSMARSGLIYTLGLPNAATVGAGLMVSYRLLDPSLGRLVSVGVVRCAVRQSNIKRVADHLQNRPFSPTITQPRPLADTVCDYRVSR